MAYIGLQPVTKVLGTSTQILSGNGVDFAYTLSRAVSKSADIRVSVDGVVLTPEEDYTANNVTVTFVTEPSNGTNNIVISFVAGALTTISIDSNAYPQGTTVAPSIKYVDALSTGIWFPSTTEVGITASGNTRVKVTNAPTATSTTSGALQVAGGAGLTGALYVGDVVRFTATTESSDTTSGALVVSGGVGVAKGLNVGGALNVSGDFTVAGAFTTTASDSLVLNDPFIFLANANPGDALDTGVISSYTDAGDSILKYTGIFRDVTDGKYKLFDNLLPEPTTVVDTGNVSFRYADLYFGNAVLNSNLATVSSTTGTLQVKGGIGATGAISLNGQNVGTAIINSGTNLVGNIGEDGASFGTVHASHFIGNGSQLTGLPAGYSNVQAQAYLTTGAGFVNSTGNLLAQSATFNALGVNGTATVNILNSTGNLLAQSATFNALGVNGTATVNILNSTGNLLAQGAIINSLTISGTAVTSTAAELNLVDGSSAGTIVNSKAVVYGAAGQVNATTLQVGGVAITSTPAEINLLNGSAAGTIVNNKAVIYNASGDVIASGISTPDITKTGTDGVGDIGQTGNRFATIYGLATSAQYADLAEKYVADADYEPGTVLHFGGEHEVSQCDVDHCTKVAGVVSTDPAYRMNDDLKAEYVAMVALTGRVPCKVRGPVGKGDMMVSAGNGHARAEANPKVGAVIGKALENFDGDEGIIEVVVGKH